MVKKVNKLILITMLLTGCTLPVRIEKDPSELEKVVNNQGQVLEQVIKILQENKLIKEPEVKQ